MTPTDPNERARELLLERYLSRGHTDESAELRVRHIERHEPAAMQAIAAALSHAAAVEGYVTVPKALTTDMLEAGEQELAMGNDFADAWEAAIDTMLGVPSFTPPPAPAAVAGGECEICKGSGEGGNPDGECAMCGGRGEVGGWAHGEGYRTDPCPDCALAAQPAAAVDEAVSRAYDAGFRVAANWMERDDLHAACGSQAYAEDKAAALSPPGRAEGEA